MSSSNDIFNSMLQEFGPPKDLNVVIKTYYQGNQVDKISLKKIQTFYYFTQAVNK